MVDLRLNLVFNVKRNHRASSRLCISDKEIRCKTSGKIYIKTKYEIFVQLNTNGKGMLNILSYVPMYTKCTPVKLLAQSNIFTSTWFSSAQNSFVTKFLRED